MNVLLQRNKRSMGGSHLYAEAKQDTWTHSRRRRREAMRTNAIDKEMSPVALGKRHHRDDSDGEKLVKRTRLEEDVSWIENMFWDFKNAEGEIIFKANFYVESEKKGFGGDSSDDDLSCSDDEEGHDVAADGGGRSCEKIDESGGVDRLIIGVQWLGGTDRDHANRVLCYLKNMLKQ